MSASCPPCRASSPGPPSHDVVTRISFEEVRPLLAQEDVVPAPSDQDVASPAAADHIVPRCHRSPCRRHRAPRSHRDRVTRRSCPDRASPRSSAGGRDNSVTRCRLRGPGSHRRIDSAWKHVSRPVPPSTMSRSASGAPRPVLVPPSIMSGPALPNRRSLPVLPTNASAPGPPRRRSFPGPALSNASMPGPPMRTSVPASPPPEVMRSSPLPPTWMSFPLTPKRPSFPGPPESRSLPATPTSSSSP